MFRMESDFESSHEMEPTITMSELEKTANLVRMNNKQLNDISLKERDDIDWILVPLSVTILKMNIIVKDNIISIKQENYRSFTIQLLIPFLFAGCGLLCTGLLLDKATSTQFFISIPQSIVLVPVLLGLKGNLEMTFASRLSTMANVGLMETSSQILIAFVSNMALIQVQSVVVSSSSVGLSVIIGLIRDEEIESAHALCLLSTSLITSSILSFLIGSIICIIIISAKKCKINPDNLSTPMAAALGDISTLATMILIGGIIFPISSSNYDILIMIVIFFILLAIISSCIAGSNELTRNILIHGWFPLIVSMCIGCTSGEILKRSIDIYPSISIFQPLINGIGGNISAVQSSRISTLLHQKTKNKNEDMRNISTFLSPIRAFFSSERDSIACRLLLLLSLIYHSLFLSIIYILHLNPYSFSIHIIIHYILVAFIQVTILLYLTQFIVHILWKYRIDPDSSSIPLLTSIGDLIGITLLFFSFSILNISFPFILFNDQSIV